MPRSSRLQRLVDDGRFDELLRAVSLAEVAHAWMAYQHRYDAEGNPGIDDRDWWAVEAWMDEGWWADENRVRAGILELVAAAESDADLDMLGAAVMEMFVADDDDRLRWLEEQARASERFRRSLANVWVWGSEADSVAQRVEAAAGVPLARPATTLNAEQLAALEVAKRLRESVGLLKEALDRHARDQVPSPGGWEVPEGSRPGSWSPPIHGMQRAPEHMPWWVELLSRVPFVDRFAREWMWFHGGFLVLPADHPFHERYGPEAYEALTGTSKAEYEHQLLEVARASLQEMVGAVTIESVELEGEGLDAGIVVLFRLADRPGARFGSRWKLWPSPHPDDYEGTPEWGTLLPTFIAIDVAKRSRWAGPPSADGIIWIQHD